MSLAKLRALLAPQGIITYTTGSDEVGQFLASRYGTYEAAGSYNEWRKRLEREVKEAKLFILGVPMDAGACFERGSFKAPIVLRNYMISQNFYELAEKEKWVDVGDVYVNPGLIDDSYYKDTLLEEVRTARRERLKELDPEAYEVIKDWDFPVAPHSVYREVLKLLYKINDVPIFTIGGDHSISRIPVEHLTEDRSSIEKGSLAILHFDAHTDLLEKRDGTPYNYATWAYHANEAIGRGKRLVQVGVRVSGLPAKTWEERLDLVQLRPEVLGEDPNGDEWADRIINDWKKIGITTLYISNDIDGVDPQYAGATGTAEKGGLKPEFVNKLVERMGQAFKIIGADLVEVAPPLARNQPGEPEKTLQVSYSYILETLHAISSHNS